MVDVTRNTDTSEKEQLRTRAEEQLSRIADVSQKFEDKSPEQIIHELQVHQIELEIQNEELKKAHYDLEASQDRYIDLYDFAPVGYFTLTKEALIVEVNLTGAAMLGVVRQDLIHSRFRRYINPDNFDQWDQFFLNILQHEDRQICNLKLVRKDDTAIFARLEGLRTKKNEGSDQIRLVVSDVTTQKLMETALVESELRYQAIFDQSPIAIELYDAEGFLLHVNPACLKLFGIPDLQAIKKFNLFTDPNIHDEQKEKLILGETIQYQGPFDFDTVTSLNLFPTKREGIIWLEVHITPIKADTNSVKGFMVQIQDITERIIVERELHESETKHRALFEAIADTVFLIDQETGKIIDVNPAATRVYGYTHDEFIQMKATDVSAEPEQTTRTINNPEADIPLRFHHHKNGQKFPVEITASTFELQGKTTIIATARDITDRKRAEEALNEASHKLRLLTGLTRHDLLNQLTAIQINNVMAMEESDIITIHQSISRANNVGKRMEATIGFTREYENFGIVSSGWQRIHQIIESSKTEVSFGNVTIENLIPEELEVFADPIIRKVFTTILENAIRHGGEITSIQFFCSDGEDALIITCEDDGIGVPLEEKTYIFDHGYGNHTGIGLFLAKEILSITGLSIRETGVPGKGARFEILVPSEKFRRDN